MHDSEQRLRVMVITFCLREALSCVHLDVFV